MDRMCQWYHFAPGSRTNVLFVRRLLLHSTNNSYINIFSFLETHFFLYVEDKPLHPKTPQRRRNCTTKSTRHSNQQEASGDTHPALLQNSRQHHPSMSCVSCPRASDSANMLAASLARSLPAGGSVQVCMWSWSVMQGSPQYFAPHIAHWAHATPTSAEASSSTLQPMQW